ncbi:hypothetical protein SDJN02_07607, partial [Cucurbita argyrosperma subsp. argyrosperma]
MKGGRRKENKDRFLMKLVILRDHQCKPNLSQNLTDGESSETSMPLELRQIFQRDSNKHPPDRFVAGQSTLEKKLRTPTDQISVLEINDSLKRQKEKTKRNWFLVSPEKGAYGENQDKADGRKK